MSGARVAAVDPARLAEALPALVASLPAPLAPLAERVLGLDAEIDLVARDPAGGAVVVRAAAAGGTLAAFADLLAQCAWLAPRLRDWQRLAPHLGLAPERGARGLLVAPGFDARTRAAAAAHGVALARVLALEVEGRSILLLEDAGAEPDASPLVRDAGRPGAAAAPAAPRPELAPARPGPPSPAPFSFGSGEVLSAPAAAERPAPPGAPVFRSGLRDEELGLPRRAPRLGPRR